MVALIQVHVHRLLNTVDVDWGVPGVPPPLLGVVASSAVQRLKFRCLKKKSNIPKNPTFLSRQFLFCLISLHATSCLGSRLDPLGQRSESTAISGWQHLHSLFYPGRSEQMLEIKSISSQTPIFKAKLVQTEENPWSTSQPFFWSCYRKCSFTLSSTVTTGCHGPLHLLS